MRLPVLEVQSFHSVFFPLGLRGVGQVGRVLGGHGELAGGRDGWDGGETVP